jgi:hypothetical protein
MPKEVHIYSEDEKVKQPQKMHLDENKLLWSQIYTL